MYEIRGPACITFLTLYKIHGTRPALGTIAIWWLGQSGDLIKSRFGTLVIDPYLSEHLTRKYEGTARPHVRMTRAVAGE